MQKTSLYQSVYTDLKSNILNKTYPIGTLIPTESELEDIYSVSRTTIRKAISLLVNEGLLSVKQGYGTVVQDFSTTQHLKQITSISETLKQNGHIVTTKNYHIEQISAPDTVRAVLCLSQDEQVYKIDRIICSDDIPTAYITNYLVATFLPGFSESSEIFSGLYHFLESKFNIVLTTAEETLYAKKASFTESLILNIPSDSPLLCSERISYINDTPFEYTISRFVSDKYKYHIFLQGR